MILRVLILAAIIPAVWLMKKVYDADRLEKEPMGYLYSLIFFGALSTLAAMVTEQLGMSALEELFPGGGFLCDVILYYVVVGLSEEGFKYLVLKWKTWRSPNFNCQFDGVVYAEFISLGFALWENIGYVLNFGFGVAVVRAVTAVPGHACFGVFMGFWYGIAKRFALIGDRGASKTARSLAVAVPVLLHGTYDFIASTTQTIFSLIFVAFVGLMFWVATKTVKKASENDVYLS